MKSKREVETAKTGSYTPVIAVIAVLLALILLVAVVIITRMRQPMIIYVEPTNDVVLYDMTNEESRRAEIKGVS